MNADMWVGVIFWWAIWTILGAAVGSRKERQNAGAALGFLFGPLGCLIALFLQDAKIKCPHCAEPHRPEATVCPSCRISLVAKAKPRAAVDQVTEWARTHEAQPPSVPIREPMRPRVVAASAPVVAKKEPVAVSNGHHMLCNKCGAKILLVSLAEGVNRCQSCGVAFKIAFD